MRISIIIILLFTSISLKAQQKWSLRDCVEYAIEHNRSIKRSDIQATVADINYKQSKLSRIPSLNFSSNYGYSFGKSENPSTGILENQNYFSVNMNLQSSVLIFNWFSRKNTILANEWYAAAAEAGVEKAKDDIALQVANAYLQVLLALEQMKIVGIQIQQTTSQLEIVQSRVDAGDLPILNVTEMEAQLANDSASYISARGNVEQSVLALKALMYLDAEEPFEIEVPAVEDIPIASINELQPEVIYQLALKNLPLQRMNEYNLMGASKNAVAAKGAMYPSLSAYAGLGSQYGYFRSPRYDQVFSGYVPSGLVVPDGSGGYIEVQRPVFTTGSKTGFITGDPFWNQFNNNFGEQIGLSLSIPIFNGWSARANYKRAQWNVKDLEYQVQMDKQTLKQNIYQAYTAALVAKEKFTSSEKAVKAAERTYEFSTRRYNVGMLSTLEQITNQNNLFRASLQYVINQFDYIFKMKLLEYYKGEGLTL